MGCLFPSLFFTKQIGEEDQLQLNYSRRIRRPNFWQINPFIDINDPSIFGRVIRNCDLNLSIRLNSITVRIIKKEIFWPALFP